MKITATKVIRELQEDYGWEDLAVQYKDMVKDVIKIIDQKLKEQKGISIRK